MTRDIDPEEMLPVAADFTQGFRAMGLPMPDGFAEVMVALFASLSDAVKNGCVCDVCDRLRTTVTTLENL